MLDVAMFNPNQSPTLPRWLIAIEGGTTAINAVLLAISKLIILAITLTVLTDVVFRAIGRPTSWAHDVASILLAYLFFLALSPALEAKKHIVVDAFALDLPRWLNRTLTLVAAALTIIFGAIFFWQLTKIAGQAFADNRFAVATIEYRLKWLYMVGPIGSGMFLLTALVAFAKTAIGHDDADAATGH